MLKRASKHNMAAKSIGYNWAIQFFCLLMGGFIWWVVLPSPEESRQLFFNVVDSGALKGYNITKYFTG